MDVLQPARATDLEWIDFIRQLDQTFQRDAGKYRLSLILAQPSASLARVVEFDCSHFVGRANLLPLGECGERSENYQSCRARVSNHISPRADRLSESVA